MKIFLSAKCSDLCYFRIENSKGKIINEKDDYVPSFMPGGGGDYVDLEIDSKTGTILNWRKDIVFFNNGGWKRK